MNCPLGIDELKKLRAARSDTLYIPPLDLYNEFVEELCGKVPVGNFKKISRDESHPIELHVHVSRPFERMRTEWEGDSDSDFELDIDSGEPKGPTHRFIAKTGQTIYYTEICKPAMLRVAHLREDHFLTESPVDEYTDRHV